MELNGNIDLMAPKKQRIWRWPAVINFFLGGTGAGFYLLSSLFVLTAGSPGIFEPEVFPDSGPLLVCLGLFALFFEAGRPLRAIYLLNRIRSSWMSFEILTGILFLFFSTANRLFPSALLLICGSCAALGFIISQGFIIYRSSGLIAWNVPIVPLLFASSALASGGGLFLALASLQQIRPEEMHFLIIQACLLIDVAAWAVYLIWSRDREFITATGFLRGPHSFFLIGVIGHLLPFAIITGLLVAGKTDSALEFFIAGVIGLFIMVGMMSGKVILVLGTNFMRGIVLSRPKNHAPVLKTEEACSSGGKKTLSAWIKFLNGKRNTEAIPDRSCRKSLTRANSATAAMDDSDFGFAGFGYERSNSERRNFMMNSFSKLWSRLWMRFAGLGPVGKMATRLAAWPAPPHKARVYLAYLNHRGYISAESVIHHRKFRFGSNVFLDDRVVVFQRSSGEELEMGDRVSIYRDVILETGYGGSLHIGNDSSIHPRCQINAYVSPVYIGKGVMLAPGCALYPYDHSLQPDQPIRKQPLQSKGPIVIEDEAWLGYGTIVLGGVRIGHGAAIGAGSVVTQDIPDGAIAVGNPARVVKMRSELSRTLMLDSVVRKMGAFRI